MQDPLFRGAYSYIALGSSPDDMEALGEPVDDVLFFAGEATSKDHAATVRVLRHLLHLNFTSICGAKFLSIGFVSTPAGEAAWSGSAMPYLRGAGARSVPVGPQSSEAGHGHS